MSIKKSWKSNGSEKTWSVFKIMSEFVEGFEKLVLEGGLETIKKSNYPPMHIEIWPPLENDWRTETPRARKHYTETRDGIFKMMVDMGYKVVAQAGWDYLFKHF